MTIVTIDWGERVVRKAIACKESGDVVSKKFVSDYIISNSAT